MGFLLKIVIFGVFVYGVWTTAKRWMGLFGLSRPPAPPPPQRGPAPEPRPAPQPRRVVVEDTRLCTACGAYVSASAARCGRSDCPQV